MKDKTAAALLAFFLGFLGVHRFYLKQPGLGILYFILMFVGISFLLSFIDFIVFLSMDREVFDVKYNREFVRSDGRRNYGSGYERREYQRREYSGRFQREQMPEYRRPPAREPERRRPTRETPPKPAARQNPYKRSGIEKYKDFNYDGAIQDFKKALAIDSKDKATHFNIACAYSLNEMADESFFHLSRAVENGFLDFDRIRSHDALAFLRIQDEWDGFVKRGYRLTAAAPPREPAAPTAPSLSNKDLLEQLRQLGELRDKGLLTLEEFEVQKKKLLGP
ncbi:MAG: NINE protein [Bacteroidota bacterium]